MQQETKTKLTSWSARIGMVVGVLGTLSIISSGWLWLEFPLPASAMSVEKLERGQVQIGKRVYEKDVYDDRIEIRKLKREKRKWLRLEPNNEQVQADIDEEITRLEQQLLKDELKLKKYNERIIELGE